jgi:hypothetical protein
VKEFLGPQGQHQKGDEDENMSSEKLIVADVIGSQYHGEALRKEAAKLIKLRPRQRAMSPIREVEKLGSSLIAKGRMSGPTQAMPRPKKLKQRRLQRCGETASRGRQRV